MKIDFLDGEGQFAKSVSVDATYSQQFDIPAGSLDARVYLKGEYVLTKAVKAVRDGLSLEFGCDESRRRFFLVVR